MNAIAMNGSCSGDTKPVARRRQHAVEPGAHVAIGGWTSAPATAGAARPHALALDRDSPPPIRSTARTARHHAGVRPRRSRQVMMIVRDRPAMAPRFSPDPRMNPLPRLPLARWRSMTASSAGAGRVATAQPSSRRASSTPVLGHKLVRDAADHAQAPPARRDAKVHVCQSMLTQAGAGARQAWAATPAACRPARRSARPERRFRRAARPGPRHEADRRGGPARSRRGRAGGSIPPG